MEFRLAEYADFERISRLHGTHLLQASEISRQRHRSAADDAKERSILWQTRLTNPPYGQYVLLAEEGDVLIGFVCLFGNHDFELGSLIDGIYVEDADQRSGIGRALLLKAVNWHSRYFPNTGLYTKATMSNESAVAFFRALGAKVVINPQNSDDQQTLIMHWAPEMLASTLMNTNPVAI